MLADGVVDVQPLVNFTAPLAQGAAGFERLRSRDRSLVKIILAPDT
jgi:threonine dehydrogenase-like Zn-dependent dehydrogenase